MSKSDQPAGVAVDQGVRRFGTCAPAMTRDEFVRSYCELSGLTWEWLSGSDGNQVALPCACGDETCPGRAMVANDPLGLKSHADLYALR